MERPLYSSFDWFVENERQEGYSGQTKLNIWDQLPRQMEIRHGSTYSNRSICPDPCVLSIFQGSARVFYNTMNCECGQAHASQALENSPLGHHAPVIVYRGDVSRLRSGRATRYLISCISCFYQRYSLGVWMKNVQVPDISLIALMTHIPDKVSP